MQIAGGSQLLGRRWPSLREVASRDHEAHTGNTRAPGRLRPSRMFAAGVMFSVVAAASSYLIVGNTTEAPSPPSPPRPVEDVPPRTARAPPLAASREPEPPPVRSVASADPPDVAALFKPATDLPRRLSPTNVTLLPIATPPGPTATVSPASPTPDPPSKPERLSPRAPVSRPTSSTPIRRVSRETRPVAEPHVTGSAPDARNRRPSPPDTAGEGRSKPWELPSVLGPDG